MNKSVDLDVIEGSVPGFAFAGGNIGNIFSAAIPIIILFAGFALLIYLMLGGYSLLVSGGDPGKIATGRMRIVQALIGFGVILLAAVIVELFGDLLGISKITNIFN